MLRSFMRWMASVPASCKSKSGPQTLPLVEQEGEEKGDGFPQGSRASKSKKATRVQRSTHFVFGLWDAVMSCLNSCGEVSLIAQSPSMGWMQINLDDWSKQVSSIIYWGCRMCHIPMSYPFTHLCNQEKVNNSTLTFKLKDQRLMMPAVTVINFISVAIKLFVNFYLQWKIIHVVKPTV